MAEVYQIKGKHVSLLEQSGAVVRCFLETPGIYTHLHLHQLNSHVHKILVYRVMSQVSCSVKTPKSNRSNEGMLFINVEMSTMAAEHFEAGRLGQLGIEVNRLVERCIKGKMILLNYF